MMAFDMFAGEFHEAITHEEEAIFELTSKNERKFPHLTFIHKSFYKDPKISPSQAGSLASELVDLLNCSGGSMNTNFSAAVKRLVSFFKAAHLNQQEIRCQSD
jgi:hypothetical protein